MMEIVMRHYLRERSARQITVGYDGASGRIASADIGGMAHTWSYLEGSDLKSRLDYGDVGSAEWSYEPNRDLLTQVKNSAHGRVISQYDYTNDAAGRRTSKNNELYGYNERSELISATGNGNYSYVYDDIGNRISSSEPDNSFAYTANSLNQYTGISAVNLNLEPQPFIPQYDLDGNQTLIKTKTGIWSVTYNGENRPIDWTCGATNIVMKYDRMGRRVEYLETVSDLVDATITTNKHQRFIYDNYLCVERLDASNTNSVTDVFVWDPTEPIATRPLQRQTSSDTYLYFHDGNKNVTDVVLTISGENCVSHFNYSQFGAVVDGSHITSFHNPLQYSSEVAGENNSLIFYIRRTYDSYSGRFCSRDEMNDVNEYVNCNNDLINDYDILGMASAKKLQRNVRNVRKFITNLDNNLKSGKDFLSNVYDFLQGSFDQRDTDPRIEFVKEGMDRCMDGLVPGRCPACCIMVGRRMFDDFYLESASVEFRPCSEVTTKFLLPSSQFLQFAPIFIKR